MVDSISKCSGGNDIYAKISNPYAKMAPPPKQMDSIKSLRSQMEREAVANVGKLFEKFSVVGRAGKIVFLAIAMPPYLLLYGMPKWMLFVVLPTIFHHSFRPFKMIREKVKDVFKPKENDKGILNGLRNALSAASTRAAEYIQWINRTSKALFVHMKHQVIGLGYRLLQPFLPSIQQGLNAAETATKMLLQKTREKGDKQLELAREFASLAWKVAKQEFSNQLRPYAELLKTTFNNLRKFAKRVIEKPRIEIQKFKRAITHRLKRTNEVLKSTGLTVSKAATMVASALSSYIARPIIEWSTPKIQWAASASQAGRNMMAHRFEQIRGFIQNVASGALETARLSRNAVITVVKNVFEAITPAFVKQFFNPEGGFKKKSQEMIQNFGQKIKKLKETAAQYSSDILKAAKNQLFGFMKKVQKFFVYMGHQIKLLPNRLFKLATKSYRLSIYASVKTGHFLRWTAVWSRVLARLAWQELREKSASIMNISN